jgi:hypothetical protein
MKSNQNWDCGWVGTWLSRIGHGFSGGWEFGLFIAFMYIKSRSRRKSNLIGLLLDRFARIVQSELKLKVIVKVDFISRPMA